MKKQIFILVLALFASFQIFAQNTAHDAPSCTGSAATPSPGVTYPYTVTIPNTGGYTGTGTFDWYVMTQGQLDLLNGTHIGAANTLFTPSFTASGTYDAPSAGANTININWTSAALATAQPYFLVVVYEETLGCTTNNMKVYRVDPINTFWLKLDNGTTTQCAAPVSSAVLDMTAGNVTYLYGTNTLTATMTASGYTGNFAGTLRLGGLDAEQTVVVTWAGASGGSGTFTAPATSNGDYTATLPSLYTGEVITMTITVTNNQFENTAGQTVTLAVDGTFTGGATTFNDKSNVNGACTDETAFADATTQAITARPTVSPSSPAAFFPVAP